MRSEFKMSARDDEGIRGPREDSGFYGSYISDLDGNKLCIYHM